MALKEVPFEDYEAPPHDGIWPDNFLINKDWVDQNVNYQFTVLPNSGSMSIRRQDSETGEGLLEISHLAVADHITTVIYRINETVLIEDTDVECYEMIRG
ncbi:hypothetical protein SEA_JUMBO_26 [Gordonia phage Jumbo]|uniref:Uncharacterized protein n=1 Tax=Gordonia phage Jumbo TaxID=1887650 RepID=A0A1B3B0I9_9CAUD|nr:hypothetical protein BIZ69_gp026 [Gordonia phage Jumbo]AOE44537.1 hypothetical protein SEA_JUMBO_26 [Gordonia phage Jumbo]